MEFLTALLLGVVQGITEFLPVSSTGHLVFLEQLFGFQTPATLFHAFVHLGSAAAVILAFRKDVIRLLMESGRILDGALKNCGIFFRSVRKGVDPDYTKAVRTNFRRLAQMIAAATVPTALVGVFFSITASGSMSRLVFAGVGFLLTGVILLVSSMLKPKNEMPKDIPMNRMFLIGFAQGFSVFPGISRFAVTMCGGILSGFGKKTALRVSFLLFIPAAIGSFIFEVIRAGAGGQFTPTILMMCLTGMIASAVVGFIFIRQTLRFVQTRSLKGFAYYAFFAGIVAVTAGFLL